MKITIKRAASWALSLYLNPDLMEIIQIAKTVYDFLCLFFDWLPNIP